ncbi:hypothetical protein THSYN_14980 [Candidatus Thiodictyon syntrophicum]|uniref:Uncharacterized protein n=2 Tax=Candidatus Thiodictyon syntrophicum TaxID=1166950 RepID=A0A2K8U993_9GAMM|nr:hypothetical protein THSYN_14980 [Candidatus Thiodictyon syntrophicum]
MRLIGSRLIRWMGTARAMPIPKRRGGRMGITPRPCQFCVLLVTLTCALFSAGCGQGSPTDPKGQAAGGRERSAGPTTADQFAGIDAAKVPAIRRVEDPAMAGAASGQVLADGVAREGVPEPRTAPPGEVLVAVPVPEPSTFTIDATTQRVFLPGRGWKTAAEFWDLYYNRPQELPGNIDHHALATLKQGPR